MEKVLINVRIKGINVKYEREWLAYGDVFGIMESVQDKFKFSNPGFGLKIGDKLQIGVSENKTGNSINLSVVVGDKHGS